MSAGKKAGVRAEGGQVTGEVGGGRPCGQVEGHGAGARAGELPDRAVCRRRRRWAQSGDRECGDACEENQHHHAGEDDDLASRRACSVPGGVGRRGGRVGRLVDGHGRSFLPGLRPLSAWRISPCQPPVCWRCAGDIAAGHKLAVPRQAGHGDRGTCGWPPARAGKRRGGSLTISRPGWAGRPARAWRQLPAGPATPGR